MNPSDYRKYRDNSHSSRTYHKKDGTPLRARLKRESQKEIEEIAIMTNYEKYLQYCKDNAKAEEGDFFNGICKLFDVTVGTAYNLWYAPQRSWFVPQMFDELIRLDKNPDEFRPCLATGEWTWQDGKFLSAKEPTWNLHVENQVNFLWLSLFIEKVRWHSLKLW